jgi:hypothetical protein
MDGRRLGNLLHTATDAITVGSKSARVVSVVVLLYRAEAPAVVQVSVGSGANDVLRLAIAVAAT